MATSEIRLCYIPYEELKKNKDIPKSFLGFFWWLLRSIVKGIIKNFPKNLLIPIILMLAYMIVNVVYMGIINDTMYIDNPDKSIMAYIFSGYAVVGDAIKGFDYFPNRYDVRSIYWTIPMLFLLTGLLKNLISRIRRNGFKKLLEDITKIGNFAKVYSKASSKTIGSHVLLGCFYASILGLIIQSPITLFLLPIVLFLSFSLREDSKIIGLVSMFRISINIKKKNPKYVNIANIALGVYGLAIGFSIYFIIVMILWTIFRYSIFARIIFTAIMSVSSFLLYKTKGKKTTKNTVGLIILMIVAFAVFTSVNFVIYADDGGWSESGKTLVGWLSNPGTKLLAALGLQGGAGTALGWLADTALGGILPALGLGEALTVAQVLCGAGSPTDLGFAALETALGPLGPLGSAISDAWKGSIDALGGAEGSSSGSEAGSGSSSDSGSTGSGSSSDGGYSGSGSSSDSGYSGSGSSSDSGNTGSGSSSDSGNTGSGSSSDSGYSGSGSSSDSGNTGSGSSSDSGSTGTGSSSDSGSTGSDSTSDTSGTSTGNSGASSGGLPRGTNVNNESWKDRIEELEEEEKKKLFGGEESPEEDNS